MKLNQNNHNTFLFYALLIAMFLGLLRSPTTPWQLLPVVHCRMNPGW
ncbi:MAG: hypothetical protein IPP22_09170 [Nitrosomonas sp.]|nr:hypothetical protein [Nitrosomonas sp.]